MKTLLALLVMFALPLFMPVLPIPGLPGFLAGLLGGYLAGRPGRAVQLALLPALVISLVIAVVGLGTGFPLVGALLAGITLIWLAIEHIALIIGAGIGGLLAVRSERSRRLSVPPPASPMTTASDLRVARPDEVARYAPERTRPALDGAHHRSRRPEVL
ncbi:MAG: hypothetical protein M3O34_09910 [Chloroflexota bacterium]|nr:hypothetical protein [Chloroflexota bacterium]